MPNDNNNERRKLELGDNDNEAEKRDFTPNHPISADDLAHSTKRRQLADENIANEDDLELIARRLTGYRGDDIVFVGTDDVHYYCLWSEGGRGRGNKKGHNIYFTYRSAMQALVNRDGRSARLSDIMVSPLY